MQTEFGGVTISHPGHSSFILESQGKAVYIDPYVIPESPKRADLILVTHAHQDHCGDLSKITGPKTAVLGPKSCRGITGPVTPGEITDLGWVRIEAVPAYNTNKRFHPKGEGVGYIITLNGVRFYHAGDTDLIPEMSSFKADVAFLPIGGTYTMDASEAIEAALRLKPKLVIPMHYGHIPGTDADPRKFRQALLEKGIESRTI